MADHLVNVLKIMCQNNDHETVLSVLQVLGKVRRGGYMSIKEQVYCLSYCANSFADQDNMGFFREFEQYMPDIRQDDNENPFSVQSKCYYFLSSKTSKYVTRITELYPNITKDEVTEYLKAVILNNKIYTSKQLDAFVTPLLLERQEMSADELKKVCSQYRKPIVVRAGFKL